MRNVRAIGPFEYRWPDSKEQFDQGLEGTAEAGGRAYAVRHGIGYRHVYGRKRVHTVTWIDRSPAVEGVGADDFEVSHSLVSAIKGRDRKLVRTEDDLPNGYERFAIVWHADEIRAPYTRRALAVKIDVEDIESWVAVGLLRAAEPVARPTAEASVEQVPTPVPVPSALESVSSTIDKRR